MPFKSAPFAEVVRRLSVFALSASLALVWAGCSDSPPGKSNAGGSDKVAAPDTKPAEPGPGPAKPAPAAGAADKTPPSRVPQVERPRRPVLALSLNGSGSADVFRGRPLLATLEVLHPTAFQSKVEPIVIGGAGKTWADAVRIEVRDDKAKLHVWPLRRFASEEPSLTLAADAAGEIGWLLSPEHAAALPPGEYELVAVLDTTGSTDEKAWKGTARSLPAAVRIADLTASPSPQQEIESFLLLAQYDTAVGDPARAAVRVDELLAKHPKSIAGLSAKGDLLAAAGKADEALRFYNLAIGLILAANPKASEPPRVLLQKRNALLNAARDAGPKKPER